MLLVGVFFIVFNTYMVRYLNSNIVLALDVAIWFGGLWMCGKWRRRRINLNEKQR
jgi:hypothetical protein